jgi:DNA-binding MarR family transcriptional regulator
MIDFATIRRYTWDMRTRIDETHLAAWRAFLNAHAAVIDRIEREMAEAGQLPLTSYDVLVALSEAPDHRLRPHELADHMVLRRSTLTRLLDRLEEEGLVVRERCGTDRRGAYVVLTEGGARTLRGAWPAYARGIYAHFTSLISEEEARTLASILERVSAAARRDQPGR